MRFDYTPVPTKLPSRPYIHRPLFDVVLRGKSRALQIKAVIDTGADLCIFNYEVGEQLGFHPDQEGKREDIYGIEGTPVETWIMNVQIFVPAFNKSFDTEVGFIRSKIAVLLLGQRGFFDHFKVTIERSNDSFDLRWTG